MHLPPLVQIHINAATACMQDLRNQPHAACRAASINPGSIGDAVAHQRRQILLTVPLMMRPLRRPADEGVPVGGTISMQLSK